MASFTANAYGKTKENIEDNWNSLLPTHNNNVGKLEMWRIHPNEFGCQFVIITRFKQKRKGNDPKIQFIEKIKEV